MGWLKFLMVVMLQAWGSAAVGSITDVTGGGVRELQTISSWMEHINRHYPNIEVATAQDLNDPQARMQALKELQLLEDHLQGTAELPSHSLVHLACRNIICGD